jgi:hypothetical protein
MRPAAADPRQDVHNRLGKHGGYAATVQHRKTIPHPQPVAQIRLAIGSSPPLPCGVRTPFA